MIKKHREPKPAPIEMSPPIREAPAETDLRGISRAADCCLTTVILRVDWDIKLKWLVFGLAELCRQSDSKNDGRWRLEGRMTSGVTDVEHDSPYVVRLPLIGLQLDGLAVCYHTTHFVAWVDPNDPTGFHVPGPGYDPTKHKNAVLCKVKSCREESPKGHILVPPGFYVPPFDPELFRLVRGKQVEIQIGPVFKGEEEE